MNRTIALPQTTNPFGLPLGKSIQKWLFQYKLYHIFFWIAYHYVWTTVKMGNPLEVMSYIVSWPSNCKFVFYVVFQAIAVYFNLYYLIPKFLEKSRFPEYVVYCILTVLCTASIIVSGYFLTAYLLNSSVIDLYETDKFSFFFLNHSLPSTMASMTLAMSIKLTKNWIQSKRREQLLEKEKLETELKFLKYQFNPHFLFNTFNSIFFLIHKNPDVASASLAKFSELLRYQLYECNEMQMALSKEMEYMQNFIELEKLRQNSDLEVNLEFTGKHVGHLGIAPFILMTFVENAFKHVSKHSDQKNWIVIRLDVNQGSLDFNISNSSGVSENRDVLSYGGIGLRNVQRRLDLIYPGNYKLDIQNNKTTFEVSLKLNLSELVMTQSKQIYQENQL